MDRLDFSLEPQGNRVGGGAWQPGVVVVGVDGTLTASRAAAYATGVAARTCALLVVVHAQPVPVPAWSGFGLWFPASIGTAEECGVLSEARAAAERACGRARVETVLRTGDPVTHLCRVAQERRADVIVVGSSRSLRHRLCGSVPVRLAKRGRWPVVVVP